MRPIPLDTLRDMMKNPFYRKCCICGYYKVQFHHHLIYGGQQINELFAILPLCKKCHDEANKRYMSEKLDWVMLNRASEDELMRYSKVVNLQRRLVYLNSKFGSFTVKQNEQPKRERNSKNNSGVPDPEEDIPLAEQ